MSLFQFLFVPALICLLVNTGYAQSYPQWGELVPGPFPVGYQVFQRYDRGRYIQPKVDFEGRVNTGEKALPVQISMWYPAQPVSLPPMQFQEYLFMGRQKDTFWPLNEQARQESVEAIRSLAAFGGGIEVSDTMLLTIRQTLTAAHRDAPAAKGPFPLIISGLDGGPANGNVLSEYLASQGFVVLCTPSITRTGTLQVTQPQVALLERMGNLEYLLAFAYSHSFMDPSRLGVLGINFDGMAAVLFQLKNIQADAVVSLDGWEGKATGSQTIRQSAYYDPNKMRVPYLLVVQDEKNPPASLLPTREVFDAFPYATRYQYTIRDMNHAYLIGNLGVLPRLPAGKRAAYRFLYSSIFHFFNAYLKQESSSAAFLRRSVQANGFDPDLLLVETKKEAFPPVPTAEEFEKLIMTGQIEKATEIFRSGRRDNPGLALFDEQTLNLYAFRFAQQGQSDQVLALYRLAVEAFPNSPAALDNLGNACQKAGDPVQARHCFQKALHLLEAATSLTPKQKESLRRGLQEKLAQLGKDP